MWSRIVVIVVVFVSGLELHPYPKKNVSFKPQTKKSKGDNLLNLDVSSFIDEIFI